jgi:chromosome segregation ATPase
MIHPSNLYYLETIAELPHVEIKGERTKRYLLELIADYKDLLTRVEVAEEETAFERGEAEKACSENEDACDRMATLEQDLEDACDRMATLEQDLEEARDGIDALRAGVA